MEPHRSSSDRSPPRRRDEAPLDAAWLEKRALRYAARWESTRRGLAQLLERKVRERCERTQDESDEALALIPAVVEDLARRGYVDDERAASQLFDRLSREGRSRARIRAELARKGVPDSISERRLGEAGPEAELDAAWRLVRRRRLGPHCPDPERRETDRQRHLAVLARQGFPRDVAERVIDAKDPEGRP